ncbi:MAG: protein-disulfide reductase DsbD domain-containing protein, partial [Aestuariivirgaceae bacterium]
LLTQRGGWPNTVFITPDLKPFYGTAYVEPGEFAQLLDAVTREWSLNREAIDAESDRIAVVLSGFLTRKADARALTSETLAAAAKGLAAQFDPFAGGIGEAPKFFRPTALMFLLQQYERSGDNAALEAVERTLQSVMSGGIHDHIEGGFHRYAIDPGWRVPHFEKMLYDQAQMAEAFTRAYRLTGKSEYAATARRTLDYVLADLTSPEGGFYSARDADSEGEEGTYYVWTPEQLAAVLGAQDASYAIDTFAMIADGDFAGKVILNTDSVRGQTVPRLDVILDKLAKSRQARQKPIRDDKVIASWNGLTIASFASAAQAFNEPRYSAAAVKAATFVWTKMRSGEGFLKRSYFDGVASIDGELDDYAQLARGFIFLFDATADRRWLERALELAGKMSQAFADEAAGDFYATRQAQGFARTKPRSDVDVSSGNGAALDVLARLARRDGYPRFKRQVEAATAALSGLALEAPASGASVLTAADSHLRGETGPVQYAGNGVLRATAMPSADKKHLALHVSIAPGWHINADKPLEDHLIPTKLELVSKGKSMPANITYPAPTVKKLAFNEKPMALLENRIEITARTTGPLPAGSAAMLEVQVCSDELCLLPETVKLRVSLPL